MLIGSLATDIATNPLVLVVIGGLLSAGGGAIAQSMSAKRDASAEQRVREREAIAFERDKLERRQASEQENLCMLQDQLVGLEAAATQLNLLWDAGSTGIHVDRWISWYELFVRARAYAYRTSNSEVAEAVLAVQQPMVAFMRASDKAERRRLMDEARERLDDANQLIGRYLTGEDG
jgi:hypothetical protein